MYHDFVHLLVVVVQVKNRVDYYHPTLDVTGRTRTLGLAAVVLLLTGCCSMQIRANNNFSPHSLGRRREAKIAVFSE
jgi:hypothetical protein